MYLKTISIRNFKTIEKLDLNLDQGLNIIFGPNEAGKSTFLEALHAALFEKADSTKSEVLRYKSWNSDADPHVRAIIVADDKEFEVEKQFLGAKKGRLTCKATGLDTTNKDRINEELAKIIPLYTYDGNSLKNTFWIRQRELEETIQNLKDDVDVRAAVQSVIFKSDGDIEAIKSAIAEKITEIGKGWKRPAKYLGPLAQSKNELDRIQSEVTELQYQFNSIESDIKKQKELTERVSALEVKINEDEEIITTVKKYRQAKENLEEANKKLDEIQNAIEAFQEHLIHVNSLKEKITEKKSRQSECEKTIAAIALGKKRADIEAELTTEQSLLVSVNQLKEHITDGENMLKQLPEISKQTLEDAHRWVNEIEVMKEALRVSQISVESKALSNIELKVAVDGSDQSHEMLKSQEIKTSRANQNIQLIVPEIVEIKVSSGVTDAVKLQQELKETEQSLADILAKYQFHSMKELSNQHEVQQHLKSNLTNLKTELTAKLNSRSIADVQRSVDTLAVELQNIPITEPPYVFKQGETLESLLLKKDELVQELANTSAELKQREAEVKRFLDTYNDVEKAKHKKIELAREAAKAEAALEVVPKMELSDDKIFTYNKRLENNKTDHTKSRDELLQISGALQKSTVSSDQVRLKEAELSNAQNIYESNLIEYEACKILQDTLTEAELGVSQNFMKPIEQIVSTTLPRLTAGRYCELSLNEKLEINSVKFQSIEVAPADLSTGAKGQVALALRLALIEHLANNERQLVIIDDALVNFDPQRLKEGKKLLSEFSKHHQILYLSCHTEIHNWDNTIIHKIV